MSETLRPNFFILLDIEPTQPWSESLFLEKLDEKRAEWTKKAKNPKNRLKYESYNRLVLQIKAVMSDVEQRKKEADAAIQQKSQEQQKWQEEFQNELTLIAAKGYVTDDEIVYLTKQYSDKKTEVDIRNELRKQRIQIQTKTAETGDLGDLLDSSEMERIKENLEKLAKKDLYDFLDASKSSRTSDLRQRAEDIYKQNLAKADKSPEVTASSELAGDAKKNFKDEDARSRYDRSLAKDKFEVLLGDKVKKIVEASSEKLIRAKQFQHLLEIARSKHLDIDRAAEFIKERAFKMRASVELVAIEEVKQKLLCTNPACGTVNDTSQNFCTNCGTPLKIACPSCGKVSPVEYGACPSCSFPIGNAFNVRSLIADSKQLIALNDYNNAEFYLKLATQEWSTIPPRSLNDELTTQLNQLLQEVENYQKRKNTLEKQLTKAMDEHYFYEARTILRQLETEFGVLEENGDRHKIDAAIREAETELLKAQKVETRGGDAVELYQNILWKCKDCKIALLSLAKIPPAPPAELSAQVGNKVVRLSWQSSPAKNVRYTIVRKYGSSPISSHDGEQLDTVVGTVYEDTNLTIGVPVYYAVYTNRESVLSTQAALLNRPVLLTADVANVVIEIADRQVSMTWEVPQYASEVLVFQSTEYQPNFNNGQRLQTINKSKIIEQNLQNGKTYYYTIYATFKNHEGNPIYSQGVSVQAIPEEPPSVIENLQVELETSPQKQLRLSWQAPRKGEVAILLSSTSPGLSKGNILTQSHISRHGNLLLSPNSKHEVIVPIKETEILYFTPIVLFQNMAYVGETAEYVNIEDVRNLRCQKQRDELQLQWEFPLGCQQVIVAYNHDNFPSNQASSGVRANVTKTQYDLLGYYPIKNLTSRDYYIVVQSVMVHNAQTIVASGLSSSARCRVNMTSDINVQYTIKRQRKLFGKNKLTLEINAVGKGEIPEILLVCKQGGLPLKKDDGDVILRVPKLMITGKRETLVFEIEQRRQSYGKLFLADDSFYKSRGGYVRIDHPSQENMEIFIR
jgi:Double zinc ribbon